MSQVDWLSHLLKMITVTGRVEARCTYGAPWRVAWGQSAANEIPYRVVLKGRAIIENQETETARELVGGDIVLLPRGSAHVLHDGSGHAPALTYDRQSPAGWAHSENDGQGEHLDMLCGRFLIGPPHDRLIRNHLPTTLIVRSMDDHGEEATGSASKDLASLVWLMCMESAEDRVGGYAILEKLSSALFTAVLRAASARHFYDKLGRSAVELLTDIRMSLAANELKKPAVTTEAVAESVGYQSVAAFQRVFAGRMGMTPEQWRRLAREGPGFSDVPTNQVTLDHPNDQR